MGTLTREAAMDKLVKVMENAKSVYLRVYTKHLDQSMVTIPEEVIVDEDSVTANEGLSKFEVIFDENGTYKWTEKGTEEKLLYIAPEDKFMVGIIITK